MFDYNTILSLPKVELHCHLEGAVRPKTIYDLAIQHGLFSSSVQIEDISKIVQVQGKCCFDLRDYLKKFDLIVDCIQTPQALEQVAFELVEDAALQNVIYLEVRFAPQLLCEKGLSVETAVRHILLGLKKGQKRFGTRTNAILIAMRNHTYKQNAEVVRVAKQLLGKGVVAIDLAGDESSYPPLMHMDLFDHARKLGIPYTIHAGECGSQENIKEAILLGASRIGHGIKLRNDKYLVQYFVKRGIGIEMCPTSNMQTRTVEAWEDYPITDFYRQGLKLAVCTDNPTVSNTNLTQEFYLLALNYDFGLAEMKKITENSIDMSFAEPSLRKQMKYLVLEKYRYLTNM